MRRTFSPARSEPGALAVILYDGRFIVIRSGWPPVGMIESPITHLGVKLIGRGMSLHQPVRPPPHRVEQRAPLARFFIPRPVLQTSQESIVTVELSGKVNFM